MKQSWIGRVIGGQYEIAEKLAESGHSQVYWGKNLRESGDDAAIKVLVDGEDNPFASDRLHREGTVLCRLSRAPAVARLIDRLYTPEGSLVLVLELLDGMSLQSILERGEQRLSPDEVISLFTPVIETLSQLHQQGMIHRNLNPGKLYRSWDPPGLKLLGFGDTRSVQHSVLLDSDRYCGHPQYVSPEVWEGKSDLDVRSDVYSMAVILFRCLAGRCPFENNSSADLVKVVSNAARPSLVLLCPDLPDALDDWVSIALASERDARFDNVEAMWRAFVAACRSQNDVALSAASAGQQQVG